VVGYGLVELEVNSSISGDFYENLIGTLVNRVFLFLMALNARLNPSA
jgi:hypothetical protein